ncbi:acyl-ACP thioesterase [Virgibacillus natechei]|uniref:Acyl-ACP thioesterase n=1 Tax=Virgibacillus natechei TaxID=1216297 RepID=A0ABS4IGU2_9BACI|nr:acyl-ACP thioesterase domain-containing protein [Virgibacillus natechei]MBP1969800.1 acyl-ACP thioesterase [Virgibacillus natechei]UZD12664.1 thioesterase [Virgibacillus natechei]
MQNDILYKKNYHIDLRDVDFKKKLKLSTLFSYFQEVASLSSANLGAGIDDLAKNYGVAWILMRIRVEIGRMPAWDEEISIETWPQEPGKLEFERDFIVHDQEGAPIIRAVSVWVIMDLEERKLKRASHISLEYPSIMEERAIDYKLKKLKSLESMQTAYHKVIGYSDIDFNGHLNNSKYVDYMLDCFPLEDHQTHETKAIEVNFNHEALPGETIILKNGISDTNAGLVHIEGINENNQKVVFKAQVEIREINGRKKD